MPDHISDGRGSGNAWGIDNQNAGYVSYKDPSGNQLHLASGGQWAMPISGTVGVSVGDVYQISGNVFQNSGNVYVESGTITNVQSAYIASGQVTVIGSIVIGSVTAHVDTMYQTSGNVYQTSGNVNIVSGTVSNVENAYIRSGANLVGSFTQSNFTEDRYVVSGNTYQASGNVHVTSGNINAYVPSGNIYIESGVVSNVQASYQKSGNTYIQDKSGADLYLVGSPNYSVPVSGTVNGQVFVPSGNFAGSVVQTNFTEDRYVVSGNVYIESGVVSNVQNSYVRSGTITEVNNITSAYIRSGLVNIVGSITIGSVSANVDSMYMNSGNVFVVSGNTYQPSGNVYVESGTITNVQNSFITSGNINGSVVQTNFTEDRYVVSGNVYVESGVITNVQNSYQRSGNIFSMDKSGADLYYVGSPNYAVPISGAVNGNVNIVSGTITNVDSAYIRSGNIYQTSGVGYQVSGNVYIPSGIINEVNNVTSAYIASGNVHILGSIVIGSVTAHVDAMYQQSGNVFVVSGNTFQPSGNVYVVSGTVTELANLSSAYVRSGNIHVVSGTISSVEQSYLTSGIVTNVQNSYQRSGNTWLMDKSGADLYFAGSPNYRLPVSGTVRTTGDTYVVSGNTDVLNNQATTTGITIYGNEGVAGAVHPFPLWTIGGATSADYIVPIGGDDYGGAPGVHHIKVDGNGDQFIGSVQNVVNSYLTSGVVSSVEQSYLTSGNLSTLASGNMWGFLSGAAGGWRRFPLAQDGFTPAGREFVPIGGRTYTAAVGADNMRVMRVNNGGEQYHQVTDGSDVLDIMTSGLTATNGIIAYGYDETTPGTLPLPVWVHGQRQTKKSFNPIGGQNYKAAVNDLGNIAKVDDAGNLFVGSVLQMDNLTNAYITSGVISSVEQAYITSGIISNVQNSYLRSGNVFVESGVSVTRDYTIQITGTYAPIGIDPTMAVNVVKGKKEIWSDDWLHWYDDMETKNGGGLTTNKWRPNFNVSPFNVNDGMRLYVEGDVAQTGVDGPYYAYPKEGNHMLKLSNVGAEEEGIVEADAYTKLAMITNKTASLELWFSGRKNDSAAVNWTPFAFGFYHYMPNEIYTQYYQNIFLVRYYIPVAGQLPVWQFYNAAASWQTIGSDVRPAAGISANWQDDDILCWNYLKLDVDIARTSNTYEYKDFTANDTTYEIDNDCRTNNIGIGVNSPMAALCPYVYMSAPANYASGEGYYEGAAYVDNVKVYLNNLQDYAGTTPYYWGQRPSGIPG